MIDAKRILKSAKLTVAIILYGGMGITNIMNGIGLELKANQLTAKEEKTKEEKREAIMSALSGIASFGIGVGCTAISVGMADTVGRALMVQGLKKLNNN